MEYRIFSQQLVAADGQRYTGWGIEGTDGRGGRLRVEDVTEDRRYAELLAAVMNRERAEPAHVYDIISDFLTDPGDFLVDSGEKRTLLAGDDCGIMKNHHD